MRPSVFTPTFFIFILNTLWRSFSDSVCRSTWLDFQQLMKTFACFAFKLHSSLQQGSDRFPLSRVIRPWFRMFSQFVLRIQRLRSSLIKTCHRHVANRGWKLRPCSRDHVGVSEVMSGFLYPRSKSHRSAFSCWLHWKRKEITRLRFYTYSPTSCTHILWLIVTELRSVRRFYLSPLKDI